MVSAKIQIEQQIYSNETIGLKKCVRKIKQRFENFEVTDSRGSIINDRWTQMKNFGTLYRGKFLIPLTKMTKRACHH